MQRHMARSAANATQLRQIFSWLSIAPATANFIGPLAAGLMIDHAGYRAAFLMLAILPIVTWLLVRSVPEPAPAQTQSQAKGSLLDLWREPAFRRLVLINGVVSAAWDSHSFIVPVLGHDRGLSASVIGAIVGSFALAAIVSRLAMPSLSKLLREWQMIGGAMLAAALIYALYPLTTTALAMGLCSALLGTFLGIVNPLVMTLLHQVAPSHRHGEALAIRLVVINVSSVSTPLLFGLLGGAIGVIAAFWMMALALGLGSKMTMLLRGGEKGGG